MKYILFLALVILIVLKFSLLKEEYLIINGNVIFKNFNNYYNFDNLLKDLIQNNINDIKTVEKAYLKNGKLKIITSKPHIVVTNGEIDHEELKKINKTSLFIHNILNENKIKIEEILYAIYLKNDLYIVKSIAK